MKAKRHSKIALIRCRQSFKQVLLKVSFEKIICTQTLLELGHKRTKSLNLVSVELGEIPGNASCDPIVRSSSFVTYEGSNRV